MRTVALFLMLVLSGLPAAAAATADGVASLEGCVGCPDEGSAAPSDEPGSCSPVCHDCVCSLGAPMTPPLPVFSVAPELGAIGAVADASIRRSDPPREPALDDVFHPPKQ